MLKCKAATYSVASKILLVILLVSSSPAFSQLEEKLDQEIGSNPTRTELIDSLIKHAPDQIEENPDNLKIPGKYLRTLLGDQAYTFVREGALRNPFVQPEAGKLGWEVSNQLSKELTDWRFNPNSMEAFFIPNFLLPASDTQIGYLSQDIRPEILEHIFDDPKSADPKIRWWMFPENMRPYENFINGGARGISRGGLGVEYRYVGFAFSSPRSILALDLKRPELGLVHIKVNLHRTLDGHSRVMQTKKAARTILSSSLFETTPESLRLRWGFDVLPEVASWSLPFTQRINVIRDPAPLFNNRNVNYSYGYAIFSPVGGERTNDNLATKLLNGRRSKSAFEALTRDIFKRMATPFAFNSLVSGLQIEFHSANWAIAHRSDGTLLDHVMIQDLESTRVDAELRLRSGLSLKALTNFETPFLHAKHSAARGDSTMQMESGWGIESYTKPEFIGTQYLRHVRGVKTGMGQTNDSNFEGFSTIVDAARNYGRNILGLELTNEEVERWMDQEMARAFNRVKLEALGITNSEVSDITDRDVKGEVDALLEFVKDTRKGSVTSRMKTIRNEMREQGGLIKLMWEVRKHLDSKISKSDADMRIQDILRSEVERLTKLRRNTLKMYSNVNQKNLYFILHEQSRIIEIRHDTLGYRGLVSMEPDKAKGSNEFFAKIREAEKSSGAKLVLNEKSFAPMNRCARFIKDLNIMHRLSSFGSRAIAY